MWEVIGHRQVIEAWGRALQAEKMPQAVLLVGAAGVGKTHLALQLARRLNCIGSAPPCGQCIHCHQIEAGTHPDVSLIEPAEGKESIAIQQVRELRDAASLRPFQGASKVFIIAGAEALTDQAADALLKTLEEPPGGAAFILTAVDAEALPSTVVSRCQVVNLHPIPPVQLEEALAQRGQPPEMAAHLARLAQGNVGWALRAVAQPKALVEREEAIARLAGVLELDLEARLQLAESLAGERKDRAALRRNLELLALIARDVLLLSQGVPARLVEGEAAERLARQARRLGQTGGRQVLQGLRLAMERIDQNVDARLALEAFLLGLP